MELTDQIYEAAVCPDLWPAVLDRLSAMSGCRGGVLFTADWQQVSRWTVSAAITDVFGQFLAGGWMVQNTRAHRAAQLRHAGFINDFDMFTQEEMDRDPFYTELFRPLGYGWCAGTVILAPGGDVIVFDLERRYADGPVPRSDLRRLDPYRPHLARSALLATRLGLERARAAVNALAALGLPAAALRGKGRVVVANGAFEAFMPSVFADRSSRLTITDMAADKLLEEALDRLAADLQPGQSIPISSRDDRPAMILHVLPVKGAAHDVFAQAASIAILTPVSAPAAPPDALLNGLFDLTPAEARVARALVEGGTINGFALDAGLSRDTVRGHVKSVLGKTGTRRQAELVGLLGSLGSLGRVPKTPDP